MALDQTQDNLSRRSTDQLIAADRVTGTAVYDNGGERIGTIDRVMIDKYTGQVAYAVMSFGGFLGIGERYHPLPWDVLDYDTNLGGYNVGMAGSGLKDAPSYERDRIDNWNDTSEVDSYYSDAPRTGYGARRTTQRDNVGDDAFSGTKAPGGMMSGATGEFTGAPGAGTYGTGAAGGSSTVGATVTAPSGVTSSGGPTGGSYGAGTGPSDGRAGHEPSRAVGDPSGAL